jgi:hypothetical protein
MLDVAREVLEAGHPMTVRQVYYQLVSRQVIKNNRSQYQAVSSLLVEARKDGSIPWEWVEDRLRRPREVSMWTDLPDFLETVRHAYRRDVWRNQPAYLECWVEKDALSGIFEEELSRYGVTLNVGRGYDGWDSIHNAAERFLDKSRKGTAGTILYFGDFDPSGEDMARSLAFRLDFFQDDSDPPEVIKCALTPEDVERYDLPPDFAKRSDTRAAKFIARHGDVSVELDALPVDVLRSRIVEEVESRMDMHALARTRRRQKAERERLAELVDKVQ